VAGWVIRKGLEEGREMTQELYAHMNNKKIKNKSFLGGSASVDS
jgi:hypothetical protein